MQNPMRIKLMFNMLCRLPRRSLLLKICGYSNKVKRVGWSTNWGRSGYAHRQYMKMQGLIAIQAANELVGPPTREDQDMHIGNMKMKGLIAIQTANESQASASKKSVEHFVPGEWGEEGGAGLQRNSDQRGGSKPFPQGPSVGKLLSPKMIRPVHVAQTQPSIQNILNNQFAMAQCQAI
ncbi:hypothetical protein NE237_029165 [Protea cynaroides]|uniref:Uncharacterized protein n=1 Tax=Protea cynaroides TaxID=273540 RepID=A0A9Q0GRB8_9MAGN|nr:hypothetical protein NE237_029165 [Protea cynaroides]